MITPLHVVVLFSEVHQFNQLSSSVLFWGQSAQNKCFQAIDVYPMYLWDGYPVDSKMEFACNVYRFYISKMLVFFNPSWGDWVIFWEIVLHWLRSGVDYPRYVQFDLQQLSFSYKHKFNLGFLKRICQLLLGVADLNETTTRRQLRNTRPILDFETGRVLAFLKLSPTVIMPT